MVAPGPPSNIKVDVVSSYELNVSWDLPAEANGVITRYEVTIYEKEKENVNETHDAKLEKSKLFIGLEPFTSYMVEVQASTKAGRGNWSDAVVARTYPERKIELICGHDQRTLVIYPMCTKIVFIVQFNGHKRSFYHVQLMRDDHTTNVSIMTFLVYKSIVVNVRFMRIKHSCFYYYYRFYFLICNEL